MLFLGSLVFTLTKTFHFLWCFKRLQLFKKFLLDRGLGALNLILITKPWASFWYSGYAKLLAWGFQYLPYRPLGDSPISLFNFFFFFFFLSSSAPAIQIISFISFVNFARSKWLLVERKKREREVSWFFNFLSFFLFLFWFSDNFCEH